MTGDEEWERDAIEPASDRSGSKFPTFLEAGYARITPLGWNSHFIQSGHRRLFVMAGMPLCELHQSELLNFISVHA